MYTYIYIYTHVFMLPQTCWWNPGKSPICYCFTLFNQPHGWTIHHLVRWVSRTKPPWLVLDCPATHVWLPKANPQFAGIWLEKPWCADQATRTALPWPAGVAWRPKVHLTYETRSKIEGLGWSKKYHLTSSVWRCLFDNLQLYYRQTWMFE